MVKGTIISDVSWLSPVGEFDDFGDKISNVMVDGKTRQGPWGLMTPKSWAEHGIGRLGAGLGQMYVRTAQGRWIKVEG